MPRAVIARSATTPVSPYMLLTIYLPGSILLRGLGCSLPRRVRERIQRAGGSRSRRSPRDAWLCSQTWTKCRSTECRYVERFETLEHERAQIQERRFDLAIRVCF